MWGVCWVCGSMDVLVSDGGKCVVCECMVGALKGFVVCVTCVGRVCVS